MRGTRCLVMAVLACATMACSREDEAPVEAVTAAAPKEPPATGAPATAVSALACPHPYLPLVEGATWDSRLVSGRTRTKVRTRIGRVSKTARRWSAPVEIRVGDRLVQSTAECVDDGAFIDTVALHGVESVRGWSGGVDLRAVGREGLLLPAGAGFEVGASWTLDLATLVSIGDALTKRATVRTAFRFSRLADEEVETPAGAFQTAHILGEATATEEAVLMGRTAPPRTLEPFRVDIWLAEGVGEVRSVATQGDARLEQTLVEYELPGDGP